MSPFVQELFSILSMLTGAVVLTSWVMWILFRPSGDSKAKDFAQESAKDGLTRCVIENNELKNVVKRLERENKVLMSAGYGKVEGQVKEEEKVKGERLKVKEEQGQGEQVKGEGQVKEERLRVKEERINEEQEGWVQGEVLKVKEEIQTEDLADMAGLLDVVSAETEPAAVPAAKKVSTQESLDFEVEPALQKITDEAEKKKIADYMANVEKATERQKKEIKKVESWKESGPHRDDDLKKIRGIGPHIEKMLKKAGITSYKQIAEFNEEDIRLVSDAIGSFPRRISREQWVEQARELLSKA